jgi:hypothetical protein
MIWKGEYECPMFFFYDMHNLIIQIVKTCYTTIYLINLIYIIQLINQKKKHIYWNIGRSWTHVYHQQIKLCA